MLKIVQQCQPPLKFNSWADHNNYLSFPSFENKEDVNNGGVCILCQGGKYAPNTPPACVFCIFKYEKLLSSRPYTIKWTVDKHWGLYARRTIRKNELITFYGGKCFDATYSPKGTHLLQVLKRGTYIDGMHTPQFTVGVMLLTDQVGSLANSSWGNPRGNNATFRINHIHHRAKIVATKEILAGSEILVPYGGAYTPSSSSTSTPHPKTTGKRKRGG